MPFHRLHDRSRVQLLKAGILCLALELVGEDAAENEEEEKEEDEQPKEDGSTKSVTRCRGPEEEEEGEDHDGRKKESQNEKDSQGKDKKDGEKSPGEDKEEKNPRKESDTGNTAACKATSTKNTAVVGTSNTSALEAALEKHLSKNFDFEKELRTFPKRPNGAKLVLREQWWLRVLNGDVDLESAPPADISAAQGEGIKGIRMKLNVGMSFSEIL
jgi:hypothetical protein